MRDIDWDNPSEEDAEWVLQYGTGTMRRKLELSDAKLASVEKAVQEERESEESPVEEAPADSYDDMTLDQLKAEAAERKREYPDFDTSGIKNKAQLIERLREWDAEHSEE
jgi:hypothetical protein